MSRSFETYLATHCAPVLLGKKPAALTAKKYLPDDCDWAALVRYGIHILPLSRLKAHTLIMVFRPTLIQKNLSNDIAMKALQGLGYPVWEGWKAQVEHLERRFLESEEFPHEVGFFLGYPPEDVLGFMNCDGECKLCGQWKVYGDVNTAVKLFEEYRNCKKKLLALLYEGRSIFDKDLSAIAVL